MFTPVLASSSFHRGKNKVQRVLMIFTDSYSLYLGPGLESDFINCFSPCVLCSPINFQLYSRNLNYLLKMSKTVEGLEKGWRKRGEREATRSPHPCPCLIYPTHNPLTLSTHPFAPRSYSQPGIPAPADTLNCFSAEILHSTFWLYKKIQKPLC